MVSSICPEHVKSALLHISVLELLLHVVTGSVTTAMLADAIATPPVAHLVAYGNNIWKPKHHFRMHIPSQLERFKLLIARFVHWRRHRIPQKWAIPNLNKQGYERTILEECKLARLWALQEPLLKPPLADPRQADAKAVCALHEDGFSTTGSVLSALSIRVNSWSDVVGDVVLYCGGGFRANIQVGEVY